MTLTERLRQLASALPSDGSAVTIIRADIVALLDLRVLHAQLQGLERRVARGGKDSIDHGPGGRDDVANAAAGALTLVSVGRGRGRLLWGRHHRQRSP